LEDNKIILNFFFIEFVISNIIQKIKISLDKNNSESIKKFRIKNSKRQINIQGSFIFYWINKFILDSSLIINEKK
jgi:hypothetical protein